MERDGAVHSGCSSSLHPRGSYAGHSAAAAEAGGGASFLAAALARCDGRETGEGRGGCGRPCMSSRRWWRPLRVHDVDEEEEEEDGARGDSESDGADDDGTDEEAAAAAAAVGAGVTALQSSPTEDWEQEINARSAFEDEELAFPPPAAWNGAASLLPYAYLPGRHHAHSRSEIFALTLSSEKQPGQFDDAQPESPPRRPSPLTSPPGQLDDAQPSPHRRRHPALHRPDPGETLAEGAEGAAVAATAAVVTFDG